MTPIDITNQIDPMSSEKEHSMSTNESDEKIAVVEQEATPKALNEVDEKVYQLLCDTLLQHMLRGEEIFSWKQFRSNINAEFDESAVMERMRSNSQYEICQDGPNDTLFKRNFTLIDPCFESSAMMWRNNIFYYLVGQNVKKTTTDIARCVIRPKELPKALVRLADVLKSDPLNRFDIIGEFDNITVGVRKIFVSPTNSSSNDPKHFKDRSPNHLKGHQWNQSSDVQSSTPESVQLRRRSTYGNSRAPTTGHYARSYSTGTKLQSERRLPRSLTDQSSFVQQQQDSDHMNRNYAWTGGSQSNINFNVQQVQNSVIYEKEQSQTPLQENATAYYPMNNYSTMQAFPVPTPQTYPVDYGMRYGYAAPQYGSTAIPYDYNHMANMKEMQPKYTPNVYMYPQNVQNVTFMPLNQYQPTNACITDANGNIYYMVAPTLPSAGGLTPIQGVHYNLSNATTTSSNNFMAQNMVFTRTYQSTELQSSGHGTSQSGDHLNSGRHFGQSSDNLSSGHRYSRSTDSPHTGHRFSQSTDSPSTDHRHSQSTDSPSTGRSLGLDISTRGTTDATHLEDGSNPECSKTHN